MTTLPSCPTPCDESNRAAPGPCQAQLHRYPTGRGAGHLGFYCVACRRYPRPDPPKQSPWVSLRSTGLTLKQAMGLPLVPGVSQPRCQVCGSLGGCELHHLAPRNVFGPTADDWPTVLVCHDCHAHWHRMMDGYSVTAPSSKSDLPNSLVHAVDDILACWEYSQDRKTYEAGHYLLHSLRRRGGVYELLRYIFHAGVEYGRKGYAR